MDHVEQIRNLDIVRVIEKYVKLKQAGGVYKGLCPFHNEKTPSFTVNPQRNIFKCFGCGQGGDGIAFVMEHEKTSFAEACRIIARQHNITIEEKTLDPQQAEEARKIHDRNESIKIATKLAASFYESQLWLPENKFALDYALSRWTEETIRMFGIGYAPNSYHSLGQWAEKSALKRSVLIEAKLIKVSDSDQNNSYDFFRHRLMIPVADHYGRIVGFSGRAFNPNDPKYINTPETPAYVKSRILFGFNTARRHIAATRHAILVEGNADVIRLHQIGILNAVASMGTALTPGQISLLKDVADSVTIIGDSDNAGINAVVENSKSLMQQGIFVNVVEIIPDNPNEKADPDSFFTDKDQYDEYANRNIVSFPIWITRRKKAKARSNDRDAQIINDVCNLLAYLPETSRTLQIDELAKIIKPKAVWVSALKTSLAAIEEKEKPVLVIEDLSPEQNRSFQKYGFYDKDNCYFFASKEGPFAGTNFIMKPLFHVQSVMAAKRLYEITNKFGHCETIELDQRDLVSLTAFKLRLESLGNFLWETSDINLGRLKRYLYEQTQTCTMITQLGWQKQGFFAWSNGIYVPENASFVSVDSYGIVTHKDMNYYIPAYSVIYRNEPSLFVFERKFKHTQSDVINMFAYVVRLREVFGDNALVAFAFLLATMFRDVIANRFGFFPLLNAFGPKGAGKTELAISLISFFGNCGKGPNINNTSKAALGDHISQVSNACVHIDEYRNDIEIEKVELLKGIWDGTGRSRMNMDKDKKKETTAVDCGVIITGQQMPTADIALFSRLVYLPFYQTEFSEEDKQRFVQLKDIEKHGLTHLTNQVLSHRAHFAKHYSDAYDAVCDDLSAKLPKGSVEDRIFRNWAVLIAAAKTLIPVLTLPFTYEDLLRISLAGIMVQAAETSSSNELSVFWNLVQYMDNEAMIVEKTDYRIKVQTDIKTDKGNLSLAEPIKVLYLQFGRVINLYRKLGAQQKTNILPADSIRKYLMNSTAYIGKVNAMRFNKLDKSNNLIFTDKFDSDGKAIPVEYITVAYAFKYDEIGIDLTFSSDIDVEPNMPF